MQNLKGVRVDVKSKPFFFFFLGPNDLRGGDRMQER